jgi:hypothetical protein
MIIFLLLFILLLILFLIINNVDKTIYETKPISKSSSPSYIKYGDEENLKDNIIGYENELMYQNNLKEGDYINQFKEPEFINITNNQIGFNPKPREQMKQLPYPNINFKCL